MFTERQRKGHQIILFDLGHLLSAREYKAYMFVASQGNLAIGEVLEMLGERVSQGRLVRAEKNNVPDYTNKMDMKQQMFQSRSNGKTNSYPVTGLSCKANTVFTVNTNPESEQTWYIALPPSKVRPATRIDICADINGVPTAQWEPYTYPSFEEMILDNVR